MCTQTHYSSVCVINGLSIWRDVAGFVAAYQHLKFVLMHNGPVAALRDIILCLGGDFSDSSNSEFRIGSWLDPRASQEVLRKKRASFP